MRGWRFLAGSMLGVVLGMGGGMLLALRGDPRKPEALQERIERFSVQVRESRMLRGPLRDMARRAVTKAREMSDRVGFRWRRIAALAQEQGGRIRARNTHRLRVAYEKGKAAMEAGRAEILSRRRSR